VSFCCVGVKAKTRQNSASSTPATSAHSSSIKTMTSTERQKNKPKRRLVTEAAPKKKSAKVVQRRSLLQAWACLGLKAYIRRHRSRCKLRWQTGISQKRQHIRSWHKCASDTQLTTNKTTSDASVFAECTSSTSVMSVEELNLNVAKCEHSSGPADFVDGTGSLSSVNKQELNLNSSNDDHITEPVNSNQFVKNAPAAVEKPVSAVDGGSEPVESDERVSNTPSSLEEVGLNMPEGDGGNEPIVPAVCVNNAAAAVKEVISTVAEDSEPVALDKSVSSTPTSVEEVDLIMSEGEHSNEPVVPAVCGNNEYTAATVDEVVSIMAADTEPVLSGECVSNIPASVEEVELNTPEGDCSREPEILAVCVNNDDTPATVEKVDLHLTEDGAIDESLISVKCISDTPSSVEEADSSSAIVVTDLSEPVVVVNLTERDTETRDALPLATAALSSSPADVTVCSANFF